LWWELRRIDNIMQNVVSMKQIEIIKKDLSPVWIKLIGVIIVLATIYKIATMTFLDVSPIVYIITNAIAVGAWTGKEIVVIDTAKNRIGEGFKIMGFIRLDWINYSGVERIFINSTSATETFRHLTRTIDINHHSYKAFLKTNEGEKVCVGVSSEKEKLIKQLKQYNISLRTEIFDNTSGVAVEIG